MFYSKTMLHVIFPETFIFGTIFMLINSKTVGFIIGPLSYKHISIDMLKPTEAICFIIFPLPYIFGTINPYLLTISISEIAFPLSRIDSSSWKFKWISFFLWLIFVFLRVYILRLITIDCFLKFQICKITTWLFFLLPSLNIIFTCLITPA